MGVWPSGHFNVTIIGLYGGCPAARCSYTASNYSSSYSSRSVIHSDMWRAYGRVQQLPPVAAHHTVNHSRNFVDPATGVHTQNIGNRVKTKLKRMKGCHAHQIPSYLMWRERHGTTYRDTVNNIIRDIAHDYPV